MKPKKILSEYQINFIRKNYKKMTDKKMGKILGLSTIFLLSYRAKKKFSKNKKPGKLKNINSRFFNIDLYKKCF